ncbi:LIM domain-containing protein WLIM2b-like [Cornus florida]|uniref:LIM domain-containing protein WLIM2b-like n=1 Tax=Cornus florida TaxID=4283 RepID=UPI00289CD66D|nr:LIM domain-containing protein WLIM2b-like [Cornus florida]
MAFSGTTQKCKACDKTVHFIEMLSADGVPYHKTCFKCSHCNGKLVISSYSSMDGALYCKPHFEQLFKEKGNIPKPVQSSAKPNDQLTRKPSKLSAFFSGTQEKCAVCSKTVYPLEKVTVEGEFYHKSCFRCAKGACFLTPSSYAALDGILYCKHHFSQLFKEKGSYNHVTRIGSIKKNTVVLPEAAAKSTPEQEAQPDNSDQAGEQS